jgi:glycosyltransferase involved in cell wall biosynthesis
MRAGSRVTPVRRPGVFVDARKAADFGIGRYITGLLSGLETLDAYDLTALVRAEAAGLLPQSVRPILSRAGHYSIGELTAVRMAFARSGAVLFHAPHYVVPFFPPGRTVVTIHDLMHLTRPEHSSTARRLYARTMIGRAVRSAARILCVSSSVARELALAYPAALDKTVVIPNGVDGRFLAEVPPETIEELRNRYRLPDCWVLFLGNDKPHKNLNGLLRAFASARAQSDAVARATLVLAGGADGRREGRARAILELGLGGAVLDLGVVPDRDVPPLVAGAAALALPSLDEGFGLPVLEAQALGTPVVCSNRGGLPEAAGDAALVVDPAPEPLAQALVTVLENEAVRRDLASRGRERAKELTWAKVAARTAAVYREVLAVPGKGATPSAPET